MRFSKVVHVGSKIQYMVPHGDLLVDPHARCDGSSFLGLEMRFIVKRLHLDVIISKKKQRAVIQTVTSRGRQMSW